MAIIFIIHYIMNRIAFRQTKLFAASVPRIRAMSSQNPIHNAAEAAGQKKDTSPSNPSVISSEGAIGKQFNPDGNIGQIGEAVGGPFSKDGVIGSQFDASKGGIAGTVEKAVDGPRNPAKK